MELATEDTAHGYCWQWTSMEMARTACPSWQSITLLVCGSGSETQEAAVYSTTRGHGNCHMIVIPSSLRILGAIEGAC